ncbi:MAG: M28 family peptidase [Phycisphaerales bacterium]
MLTLLALLSACLTLDDTAPAARVSEARLMATLRDLPRARSAVGDLEHQRGLVQAEALIESWLRDAGYEVTLEPLQWNLAWQRKHDDELGVPPRWRVPETTDDLASRTWHNIIVEVPGRETPTEVVVLGAHFDAVAGSPGADDNGSGAAGLVEIARALRGTSPRRTIRLVFFNHEELRVVGSSEHVKARRPRWNAGDERVVAMVSLEMIGYFTDAPNSQKSPAPPIKGVFEPPTVGDFIALATVSRHSPVARCLGDGMIRHAPGLKVFVADMFPVALPDMLRSDNAPFLLAGLPAMMLTDTSNFRNANYHKPTDTPDTLDPTRYTLVVRGLAGAAFDLADAEMLPVSPR